MAGNELETFISHIKAFLASPLSDDESFLKYLQEHPESDKEKSTELLDQLERKWRGRKQVVGLVEGVFDVTHVGHFGALRQAKKLVDKLIVLVNGDVSTEAHKGPLVFNETERLAMVKACRWVDEAYITPEYLVPKDILEQYGADYLLHGDDIIYGPNGDNIYSHWMDQNKFKMFRRTQGISTTDIVNRILNIENDAFWITDPFNLQASLKKKQIFNSVGRIESFRGGRGSSRPKGVVGFAPGSFDMLNFGHVRFLELAKAQCDFLIVGLFEDKLIRQIRGKNFPIFSLNERLLNVLAIRSVDDVAVNCPYKLTKPILELFEIDVVFTGMVSSNQVNDPRIDEFEEIRPLGILKVIDSGVAFNMFDFVQRVKSNQNKYELFTKKKLEKQEKYYETDAEKKDKPKEV